MHSICSLALSVLARGAALCGICGISTSVAWGDVVVLSNRSQAVVQFNAAAGKSAARGYQLAAGDLLPLACQPGDPVQVTFMSAGKRCDYTLQTNSIYYFHRDPDSDKLDLEQIAIVDHAHRLEETTKKPAEVATPPLEYTGPPRFATVKVKILVDDEERGVREVWEARLRKRIADASKILEKYAGIRLEVVACDTWVSNNQFQSFDQLLREFETNVQPGPADVAIGFSSQVSMSPETRQHIGGTRGPLSAHVLIREWSKRVSEPERLEVLIHELGHRFGAIHSPEPTSVMRPVLGDRKAIAKRFMIVFDPVNVLAMYLIAEELRDHELHRLYQVSPRTREALVSIYMTLGKAFPEDPTAAQYLALLGESPPIVARPEKNRGMTIVDSARQVRQAIVDAADRNRRLPRAAADGGSARQTGDALTTLYVRVAAITALKVPEQHRQKAFALGLAVALGDTDMFLGNSLTRDLMPRLENDGERQRRIEVIGSPTIRQRHDLARHFFFSTAIATLSSSAIAESAGLLKEMQDAQGESGFSFADLAADLAGIALADFIRDSDERLQQVGEAFTIDDFVPMIRDLPEHLSVAEFQEQFGSTSDPRFRKEANYVRSLVKRLPSNISPPAATADMGDDRP